MKAQRKVIFEKGDRVKLIDSKYHDEELPIGITETINDGYLGMSSFIPDDENLKSKHNGYIVVYNEELELISNETP